MMRKTEAFWILAGFAAIAVTAVVGILAAAVYFDVAGASLRDLPFDAEAWRAGDVRLRGRMVDDLLRRKLLDGRTREEVIALLGPADREGDTSLDYTVDVGQRFVFDPWTYTLVIRFGEETGKVEEAYCMD